MKLRDRFTNAFLSLRGKAPVIDVADVSSISNYVQNAENRLKEKPKSRKSATDHIDLKQVFRTHQDARTVRIAMDEAESTNYNREYMHQIYRQEIDEDLHVTSQWNNRKNKTHKKEWAVFPKGGDKPDENMTRLFQKPWFRNFVDAVLDSRTWGFSLIELFKWDPSEEKFVQWRNTNGKIAEAVKVINHDHVKPETGMIVQQPGLLEGLDYHDPKFKNQMIFVGGQAQGLFWKLAVPCLFKKNGVANWSEWIEVFGLDAFLIKSDTRDDDRDALLKQIRDFTTNRIAIIDKEEDVSAVGSSKVDAHKVFEMMARYQDEGISKLLHGQDVISNNTGQVVGEVGENVANDYADADAEFVASVINDELFPLMTRAKYVDLANFEFKYLQKMSMREMKERADIDKTVSEMGFSHDPEQINERYGVNVEVRQVATLPGVMNKLRDMMPEFKSKL